MNRIKEKFKVEEDLFGNGVELYEVNGEFKFKLIF